MTPVQNTIKANRKALIATLQAHRGNVANKSTLPCLEYIHIEPARGLLHSIHNNTFNYLRTPSPVHAPGLALPVCLHYRRLLDALKALTADSVDIEYTTEPVHSATVRAGKISMSIPALDPCEFPPFPAAPDVTPVLLPPDFGKALKRVLPAASTDEARPVLNAVHVKARKGETILETADGFRLYRVTIPDTGSAEYDFLLPATAAAFLTGINSGAAYYIPGPLTYARLYIEAQGIELEVNLGNLSSAKYPDLEQVIPVQPPCATYTAPFATWQEAIKPLRSVKADLLRVRATKSGLDFSIHMDESAVDLSLELPPDVYTYAEGQELNFGVNMGFFAETIEQAAANGDSPSLLLPCCNTIPLIIKGGDFTAVVMPMHTRD